MLDLPGCIAVRDTFTETVELIAEDGEAILEPTSTAIDVDVPMVILSMEQESQDA